MAEIASIGAGRAIRAQINPRSLRQQEERTRQLQVTRQARATKKQVRANEQLEQALQFGTQTVNDGQRTQQADQAFFNAQSESQDIQSSDQQFELLQADINEEILRARALENEPGPPPPLPPQEPAGTVLTPDEIEARDRLNSVPEPNLPRGSLIDISA